MARVLSPGVLAEVARLAGLYAHPRSALLPALHAAQEECGHLSEAAMADVAQVLGLPLSDVTSVATFYSMFLTEPAGRHKIRVCTNISCHLNGCGEVLERLCRGLGIRPGETTPDGRVTLEAVECLAACEEAPVVLVDADRLPRMTPAAVDDLLGRLA
jgi:NADH-quinone oxidoreductase subunit E